MEGAAACGLGADPGQKQVAQALAALADPAAFRARYHLKEDLPVLLFAVGDGNHSLATAKECYERQKRLTPPEHWDTLPARFALVELNNLHDTALEFEPIHRVVFGVEPQQLLAAMEAYYPGLIHGEGEGHVLPYVWGEHQGTITVPNPKAQLPVATLQRFLDDYLQNNPGRVDYIHGAQVARDLARRKAYHCLFAARHGQGGAVPHRDPRRGAAPQDLLHGTGAG